MKEINTQTEQVETRAQHLEWCKQRALQYADRGETVEAYSSFASDMQKHPETMNHSAIQLGMMMLMGGHLKSPMEMRKFIEGFN